ncbi:MAG: cation-transporting P-type ATPase, partial [Oscillospiraceae bacterium]
MDKSNFKEQIKIDEKYLENGLSNDDVMKMNNIYGQNVILADKKINPLKILLAQFKDIMIIILLFSTAISFFMGEIIEAITIICIVIINALIGFFQEYRTEKTLDALKKMSSPVCKVIRDGKKQSIDTRLIVPGDVILCGAGDKVCADGFIISSNNLLADESILTGESLAAQKEDYTLIKSTDNIENLINSENKLNDKKRIYMGSNILNGNCKAIVTQTGMKSQMGQVANMLCSIKEDATPLQKKLSKMGKYIGIGCLIICFAVSVLGILKGEDVFTMLITGISLSVAAIPEGLPAIVTVSLALAVGRMVKKNAIVRKLHLVETLGCATV